MTKVLCTISMSLDGFVAGPDQALERPLGAHAEERLHRWMFEGADQNPAELASITAASAYVMGRNMFAPGRGEWDRDWTGWWGPEPPYHAPVFVLTHHPRDPITMEGGTTFTFVTDGAEAALDPRRRLPVTATWRSWVAPTRSTSTCAPVSSTSCGCTWRLSCSERERACSMRCR